MRVVKIIMNSVIECLSALRVTYCNMFEPCGTKALMYSISSDFSVKGLTIKQFHCSNRNGRQYSTKFLRDFIAAGTRISFFLTFLKRFHSFTKGKIGIGFDQILKRYL